MNYRKIYDQLIIRSRTEQRKKKKGVYYEEHHIIPKCLGGSDEKFNLVLLTGREHFIAHWLLYRIYPDNIKILFAFNGMCHRWGLKGRKDYKVNSRVYEKLKNKVAKAVSKQNKGRKLTEEQRQKLSKSLKEGYASGKYKPTARCGEHNGMYGKKRPQYVKDAVAKANRERVWTVEMRAKTGVRGPKNPWFGKHITPEMKLKLVLSRCLKQASAIEPLGISETTWDSYRISPYCGLVYVNKTFGSLKNLLDLLNTQFNTHFSIIN